jgi:hypothetical protein
MYMFSAKCMQISAFRSPACWLYPLKPGGEQKSAYICQKTYTLFYPDQSLAAKIPHLKEQNKILKISSMFQLSQAREY